MAPVLTSPLVSTQWLADHLGGDELVVLDASVRLSGTLPEITWSSAREDYEQRGHIPGALYADTLHAFSADNSDLPFSRPCAEQFERTIGAFGISAGTTVVVYDDADGSWAARLWWIFRSFGFESAAVLNGGFTKWLREERPVRAGALTTTPDTPSPERTFVAGEERPVWADRERVLRAVNGIDPAALVLAADEDQLGTTHPPIIPGSTIVPIRHVVDDASNTYRPQAALADAFSTVLDADEVVTYCGVGNEACVSALALTILGHERVRVYDGSLAEWWQDAERIAS